MAEPDDIYIKSFTETIKQDCFFSVYWIDEFQSESWLIISY